MEFCFRDHKVLLNDIFSELDGSSGIKNIITDSDRLTLGGVQCKELIYKQKLR